MKNKRLYVFILFMISFQLYGQVQKTYLDYYREKLRIDSKPVKTTDYNDIKGSPYLTDDFINSKVFFRNDSVLEMALRYNIFDQSMEYVFEDVIYAISNPDIIEKDKWTFIYYHNWENTEFNSYYELLVSGKRYLLAKKEISFRKEEPPKAIVESEPAKFINRSDSYFVVVDALLPKLIKNKKSLNEIFPDKKEEIGSFIKKEKISHKKEDDLIKLLEDYNSLNSDT